jgi:hypothetical protein
MEETDSVSCPMVVFDMTGIELPGMLCKQNSAAMFLTHVSPASLLDGSSRRIRIE